MKQLTVKNAWISIYELEGGGIQISTEKYSTCFFGDGLKRIKLLKDKIVLVVDHHYVRKDNMTEREEMSLYGACKGVAIEIMKILGDVPEGLQIVLQF